MRYFIDYVCFVTPAVGLGAAVSIDYRSIISYSSYIFSKSGYKISGMRGKSIAENVYYYLLFNLLEYYSRVYVANIIIKYYGGYGFA